MKGTTKFLALCGLAMLGMTALGAGATRRALPGDLPAPLERMTADDLFAFGASLQFDNGPLQDRDCERGACKGRVDAVRDQTPGPANIGPNGTIVARLVNLGAAGRNDGREQRYHTAIGNAAAFYLIALPDGNGGWTWTVQQAVSQVGTPSIPMASGTWVVCRHDPAVAGHPKGRSEFASCGSAQSGEDDLIRTSGPRGREEGASLRFPPRDPAWLSCTDGCCTAGI